MNAATSNISSKTVLNKKIVLRFACRCSKEWVLISNEVVKFCENSYGTQTSSLYAKSILMAPCQNIVRIVIIG